MPFWAEINGNTLVVLPNYYDSPRNAKIRLINGNSEAYIIIRQEVGKTPATDIPKVSPHNLYYDMDGGDRFVIINIPNRWNITNDLDWVKVNVLEGEENEVVRVSVEPNSGDFREGIITVLDNETNEAYIIHIFQTEFIEKLSVTPTTIRFDAEGGTATIKITSNTDWVIEN